MTTVKIINQQYELEKYLKENCINKNAIKVGGRKWQRYPMISKFATTYLCIPSTSTINSV